MWGKCMRNMDINIFLMKRYGISAEVIKNKFTSFDRLYYLDENAVLEKEKFYCDYFNLSPKDFAKFVKEIPGVLVLNPETVINKSEYLMKEFNVSHEDLCKIFRAEPKLLSFNQNNFLSKAEFLMNTLKLSKKDVGIIFRNYAKIFFFDIDNMNGKLEKLQEIFDLNKDELKQVINRFPNLLAQNMSSIKEKSMFIKQTFDLSYEELKEMTINYPTILSFTEAGLVEKKQNFDTVNIDKNFIVKNPRIIASPANTFVLRYKLNYVIFGDDSFLKRGGQFLFSEKKVWARYAYLKENNRLTSLSKLFFSDKQFEKREGVDSERLLNKYPLNEKVINYIEQRYTALQKENTKSDEVSI